MTDNPEKFETSDLILFQTIERSRMAAIHFIASHVTSMLLMHCRILQLKTHLLRSCRKPLQKLVVTKAWLHSRGDPSQFIRYCHTAVTSMGFVYVATPVWQAPHRS